MISYITGILTEIETDRVIIESNGIGYGISIPTSILSILPNLGEKIKLYTYFYIREDALNLYGFIQKGDLHIFRLLLGVNGIGPKAALGLLSALTPDNLRFAILAEDVCAISKTPGIGAKTAKKLILELKDKIELSELSPINETNDISQTKDKGIQKEAIMALTALGYSSSDALKAVKKVEITKDTTVEELLKAALRNF